MSYVRVINKGSRQLPKGIAADKALNAVLGYIQGAHIVTDK